MDIVQLLFLSVSRIVDWSRLSGSISDRVAFWH